jgi:hypothetical protein
VATLLLAASLPATGPEPRARAAYPATGVVAATAAPLNIVFVVSDDERVDGTGVMHDVRRLLARHGVTLTNFNVTTSECGPSRATILTGQYGHHDGVTDNFGPYGYPASTRARTSQSGCVRPATTTLWSAST